MWCQGRPALFLPRNLREAGHAHCINFSSQSSCRFGRLWEYSFNRFLRCSKNICLLLSFTVLMLVLLVTYISLSVWMLAFSTEINCTSFVFCERRRRAACTSSSADIRSSSAFFARSSIWNNFVDVHGSHSIATECVLHAFSYLFLFLSYLF